ncbi:hypothetical protein NLG97_g961 [Lecanicillium saksenae]|uniref:Uncharacterized protein n=1 Tax=Lecanicillium saksenae TaxID=468837 RepID=A0ACC1R8F8_9HYPO|nr:hypothetical protein NLG97_g961 [Lecanicillium saksenae]
MAAVSDTSGAQGQDIGQTCTSTQSFKIPRIGITQTHSQSTTSHLLNLPPEILIQIFTHSPTSDAVILALTCKLLLSVAARCNIQVPRPEHHREMWGLVSTPRELFDERAPLCLCGQLHSILTRFLQNHAQAQPPLAWNLCPDCACYRPTSQAYWLDKRSKTRHIWGTDRDDIWQSAAAQFAAAAGVQCPLCRVVVDELGQLETTYCQGDPCFI